MADRRLGQRQLGTDAVHAPLARAEHQEDPKACRVREQPAAPSYVLLASAAASYVTGKVFGNVGGDAPY